MVTLLLDSTQLEVVLSGTEKTLAFRRRNVVIERSTIRKVQLTDDAWTWLRGIPSPGTYVRGVIAMGTWKPAGGDDQPDFAIVRRRRPSVVIDLDGLDAREAQAEAAFGHGLEHEVVRQPVGGVELVAAVGADGAGECFDCHERGSVADYVADHVEQPGAAPDVVGAYGRVMAHASQVQVGAHRHPPESLLRSSRASIVEPVSVSLMSACPSDVHVQ